MIRHLWNRNSRRTRPVNRRRRNLSAHVEPLNSRRLFAADMMPALAEPSDLAAEVFELGVFNRDGVPDIISAPGPGGGPHVRVFNGSNQ